jgi:hypothetical protein
LPNLKAKRIVRSCACSVARTRPDERRVGLVTTGNGRCFFCESLSYCIRERERERESLRKSLYPTDCAQSFVASGTRTAKPLVLGRSHRQSEPATRVVKSNHIDGSSADTRSPARRHNTRRCRHSSVAPSVVAVKRDLTALSHVVHSLIRRSLSVILINYHRRPSFDSYDDDLAPLRTTLNQSNQPKIDFLFKLASNSITLSFKH